MEQHEDIWLVQLSNGAVRAMTLDELDAAFQEGTIDEDTFVRRDDATKWSRLRDELGGDDVAATPTPAPVAAAIEYQPLHSTRPVVSEVDFDEIEMPFQKSRKRVFVIGGAIGAATLAIAIFGATKVGSSASDAHVGASVVNAVQPQVVVTPPPPPLDPQPTLTDDQKKALSNMDVQHNQKMEQRRQNRIKNAPPAPHKNSPPPFKKGGSEHDPLNSKI